MIRTLIRIASVIAKAVLAVIATILIVPGVGIVGTYCFPARADPPRRQKNVDAATIRATNLSINPPGM